MKWSEARNNRCTLHPVCTHFQLFVCSADNLHAAAECRGEFVGVVVNQYHACPHFCGLFLKFVQRALIAHARTKCSAPARSGFQFAHALQSDDIAFHVSHHYLFPVGFSFDYWHLNALRALLPSSRSIDDVLDFPFVFLIQQLLARKLVLDARFSILNNFHVQFLACSQHHFVLRLGTHSH